MIRRIVTAAAVLALALMRSPAASGQQRPLPTETPDGVGSGNVRLQAGVDYARDVRFPLSGLQGNLWRVALVRIDVGLSDIADVDISGGLRDHLAITSRTPARLSDVLQLTDPNATGAFDDVVIGTKIRLRPDLAVRVATRLPNAKHPSGLGQDTTDFFCTLIAGRSIGNVRVAGNLGLGVLGDPLQGNRRVNSLLYGASSTYATGALVDFTAGLDGRSGPDEPGLERRAIARAGIVRARGVARVELDATFGLTGRDGNLGFLVSTAFTFHAFAP